MSWENKFYCWLFPILLLLQGCGFYREKQLADATATPAIGARVSYSRVRESVFLPSCIKCHGNSGGVNLESLSSIRANLSRVERAVFVDRTMPKNGQLGATEAKLLRDWIRAGAPDVDPDPQANPTPSPSPSTSPPPGGGAADPPTNPAEASYSTVRTRIFVPKCIVCHGTSGGLNFESYASIKENLGRIAVATLVDKTMPKGGSLNQDEALLLTSWIKAGGPEGSSGPQPPTPPVVIEPLRPTFSSIKKRVFDARCMVCHSGPTPRGDVSFESLKILQGSSREPLKMEDDGDPSSSGLGIVIERTDDKRMPPPSTGPSLSSEEIDTIKKWIKDGAPE